MSADAITEMVRRSNSIEDEASELIRRRPGLAREVAKQLELRQPQGLTRRQRELLVFIRSYIGSHGVPPSFDEMMVGVGLASKSGIHRILNALEERGALMRMANRARAIRLCAA